MRPSRSATSRGSTGLSAPVVEHKIQVQHGANLSASLCHRIREAAYFEAGAKHAFPVAALCKGALLDEATPGPGAGAFVWNDQLRQRCFDAAKTLDAFTAWLRMGGAFCAERRKRLPPVEGDSLEAAVGRGVGTLRGVVRPKLKG